MGWLWITSKWSDSRNIIWIIIKHPEMHQRSKFSLLVIYRLRIYWRGWMYIHMVSHVLPRPFKSHYVDVLMGAMASKITILTIVYSTVYSSTDDRKHQSPASLAFVRVIHRWPLNSPYKGPVTRKMFPFDGAIMIHCYQSNNETTLNIWTKHITRSR